MAATQVPMASAFPTRSSAVTDAMAALTCRVSTSTAPLDEAYALEPGLVKRVSPEEM
jgi:hypothetical protein